MIQAPKPVTTEHPGARLLAMSVNIAVFATGCALAAILYAHVSVWCFVVPPILGFASLFLRIAVTGDAKH
jgi:hypothetical protein